MSSGAIQYGVPTSDFRRGTSLFTWAQNPKSESFTWRPEKAAHENAVLPSATVQAADAPFSVLPSRINPAL